MPWLVLGLSFLIAAFLGLRWFVGADPKMLVKGLRYGGGGVVLLIAVFLMATGRFGLVLPVAIFGYMIARGRPLFGGGGFGFPGFRPRGFGFPGGAAPSGGQTSEVATAWLRLVLDHDSGEMAGTVLKGAFAGRALDDLAFADLIALRSEIGGDDPQSATLLETYLERVHGPDWRQQAGAAGGPGGATGGSAAGGAAGGQPMTLAEAWAVLGLEPGADDRAIREAHHRLMKNLHPDQGGSTYLAAKINEAKDLLLRHRAGLA